MSERLPSRREALSLLLKAGCSRKVVEHCKAVERVAVQIAK
ncbi:HD domain-containing protein, partial [Candidatus Bathyarchaeota archaeon]|nr:HD domain-containing protein [Candidatus Bathyarchaeota archaeon]